MTAALWSFACSDAPAPIVGHAHSATAEARWAHRFLPFEASWRPESEVPKDPQKSPGMVIWEVSTFPEGETASEAHRKAAEDFRERCYQAAVRNGWLDFQKGLADGYRIMFGDRQHYAKWEFVRDGRVLDPDRPEFLMYYGTPQGKKLAGFMFLSDTPEGPGPQIGGPLTVWHWHTWTWKGCLREGLLSVGIADKQGRCEDGEATHRSPEMLHLWLIDHRDGTFATNMTIPPTEFRELAEKRRKERGAPW
jgi:hypothetical protein